MFSKQILDRIYSTALAKMTAFLVLKYILSPVLKPSYAIISFQELDQWRFVSYLRPQIYQPWYMVHCVWKRAGRALYVCIASVLACYYHGPLCPRTATVADTV